MPRKRPCPAPGTRKYGKKTRYTADILEKALNDIKTCKMSQRVASETYNIPRSTLKYKLKNKHNRPVGKPPVLSAEEEDCICSHIVALADHGIPVSMQDVRVIVKKYLDDQNRSIKTFKNNLPGWEWGKLFLERHSDIKQKFAHCISRKRAQVTQDIIQQYFENLRTELEGVPPSHIFNFDETGFHDNPKKERLLFKRECRNPEIIRNSTKSCFTVMFCANAAGEFVPLYVIYKAKQKWSDWIKGAPPGTRMAVTPSGWIDATTFDDWFETQLLPILKNKEGKKVIIGDNLSSHITTKCLRLCAENNIKFICLVPNSTHLLQPLDVSYFSALKTNWRQILRDWRNTKRGKIINALPKGVFAALLSKTIEAGKQTAAQNVIAGFKACGLYPFDSEVVLKKLKDYTKPMEEVRDSIGETFKNYLTELRDNDLLIKQNRKFQIPVVAGKSVSVEEVEKYYQEREAKEKGQKKGQNKLNSSNMQVPTKKKGRPIGSKNKPKSNAAVSSITNVGDTSLDADNTSIRSQTPVPGPSNIKLTSVGDSSVNQPSLLIDGTSHDVEAVCRTPSPHTYLSITDHDISFQDQPNFQIPSPTQEIEIVTSPKDITGEYEVHQGTLEKVDNGNRNKKTKEQSGGRYCVVKHEECLFPGRITRAEGPTCTISVMQKTFEGWKWPSKPDLLVCNQTSIVSYIDDKNIIKRGDSYMIEDHFLYMEWGD